MDGGSALQGYWAKAVAVDPKSGKGPITYDWYRDFLQYLLHQWYTWFAEVIVVGELLVGLGIILGGLVGLAAFFGVLPNLSFMLAGSPSTNPILFTLSILLMLAWQVAGCWGLDRFILPLLGAPWPRGRCYGASRGPGRQRPDAARQARRLASFLRLAHAWVGIMEQERVPRSKAVTTANLALTGAGEAMGKLLLPSIRAALDGMIPALAGDLRGALLARRMDGCAGYVADPCLPGCAMAPRVPRNGSGWAK